MNAKDDSTLITERCAGEALLDLLRRRAPTAQRRRVGRGGLRAATRPAPGRLEAQPVAAEPLAVPPWMKAPGAHMSASGSPSKYEAATQRGLGGTPNVVGSGVSFTPHHKLHGTITPNSLHFERHHSGVPDIDPAQHKLLLHGAVGHDPTVLAGIDGVKRHRDRVGEVGVLLRDVPAVDAVEGDELIARL